jgi:hypothetical protein
MVGQALTSQGTGAAVGSPGAVHSVVIASMSAVRLEMIGAPVLSVIAKLMAAVALASLVRSQKFTPCCTEICRAAE